MMVLVLGRFTVDFSVVNLVLLVKRDPSYSPMMASTVQQTLLILTV